MNDTNPITPQLEEILNRCHDNAERIRIAKRLEAIAAELWERAMGQKKPDASLPPFQRN